MDDKEKALKVLAELDKPPLKYEPMMAPITKILYEDTVKSIQEIEDKEFIKAVEEAAKWIEMNKHSKHYKGSEKPRKKMKQK